MKCDYAHGLTPCPNTPMRAPRLVVPATLHAAFGYPPLKMFTTLHYCELHKGEVKAADLLTARVKRDFEEAARRRRAPGFKCDFEHAFVEYALTTTPEYARFERALRESGQMLRIAMGTMRLAQ